MTPKQARFVLEYLRDPNATQAAIKAGYSSKTAYSIGQENLKKPEIAAALQKGVERLAKPTIADAAERREILTTIAREDANSQARIKAADVLNKMDAIYVLKHEVTTLTKPDLSKLSESELATLESMLAKAQPAPAAVVH